MSNWVLIAAASDCPPGTAKELVAEDRIIALFNVEGNFHALDGVCPHQGGPLGQGILTGCIVTCPWHGWQFNVTTGQHQTSQSLVHPSFPIKVDGDGIYVDISDE
jgi:nitrite reductase (NADH) small subunit